MLWVFTTHPKITKHREKVNKIVGEYGSDPITARHLMIFATNDN